MKFSQSALIATLAATAVHAAPAQVDNASSDVALSDSVLAKRQDLEGTLSQLKELDEMRVKRSNMDEQLTAREYEIVTKVLSAIDDTDLAPTVLKFFVTQENLRKIAINAIVWVLENSSINLTTLLKALVDSGLLSRVLTDVLSDCEVYVSVIGIATDVIRSLLGNLFDKREQLLEGGVMTHEETVELLKKDGLMKPSMLDMEKRDIDVSNIVDNLLESLANSGLASSVVIAVLTDRAFIDFGADLIRAIMESDGETNLSIGDLVSAITNSGLIPELLDLLLDSDTLSTIGRNVLKAVTGQCGEADSSAGPSTTLAGATTPATTQPASTPKTTQAPAGDGDVGTVYTTVRKSSTMWHEAAPSDPCATYHDKREFKKLRLNY
ncbi:uncharacterized protein CXQ87_004963 [Candidozyma duobushaemuli]|uniref:Opaque-phase-specific protein OP4 n=2 Tax=Candidozyma TaxID=3303203 RepID=A0ABX8IBB6_9ASCO|nr:uncharacterized protein CXQ87_004963 [[Candida] duobushaemulonis]PVH16667.1 hypothetical protein CXQ87_004963 [[Candida] duobushaemulonis]QWU90419.1 hypothetical protein CA3LBN_004780 [[Candida] haemuloni]